MTTPTHVDPILVPKLIGKNLSRARNLLKSCGAGPIEVKFVDTGKPKFEVISQSIPPGEPLEKGCAFGITVSGRSLLRYLPEVFSDPHYADPEFMDGYLGIVAHDLLEKEQQISNSNKLFNPHESPQAWLPYLASWVNLDLQNLPSRLHRSFLLTHRLHHTHKGTKGWFEKTLLLLTGLQVEMVERHWPYGFFRVGSPYHKTHRLLPPLDLWRAICVKIDTKQTHWKREWLPFIHQFLELEKPAHLIYTVVLFEGAPKAPPPPQTSRRGLRLGRTGTQLQHQLANSEELKTVSSTPPEPPEATPEPPSP
jgi:phage tail-like protein